MPLSFRRRAAAFPGNVAEDVISGFGYAADDLITSIGGVAFNVAGKAARAGWWAGKRIGRFGLKTGYRLGRGAFTGEHLKFVERATRRAAVGYGKLGAKVTKFGFRHPGLIGLGVLGAAAVAGIASAGQQSRDIRLNPANMGFAGVPVGQINGPRRIRLPGQDSTMGLTMAMHNGRI